MKKKILLLLAIAFLIVSTTVYAEESAPLGCGNLAVKVDHLSFTESGLKPSDEGTYVGLEGYMNVTENIYGGIEVGYLNPSGHMDIVKQELTYIPVEFNAKYVHQILPCVSMDGGLGISYNYCKLELTDYTGSNSDDKWIIGGQVFTDLNYTIEQFFFGLNAKYQLTESATGLSGINFGGSASLDNWRVGGQVGMKF